MHLVGYHECGIETETEMTDDLILVGLVLIFLHKLCCAGESDLGNVLLYLIRCHTKTVIDKLHGFGFRIDDNLDLCLVIIGKLIFAHHLKLFQLGDRVTAVGDQLTHKNIVVGIQPLFNDWENIIAVD